MVFKEYSNPEAKDYDITSGLKSSSNEEKINKTNKYQEALIDLIGILEDASSDELMAKYGITTQEYLHPNKETLLKVRAAISLNDKKHHSSK